MSNWRTARALNRPTGRFGGIRRAVAVAAALSLLVAGAVAIAPTSTAEAKVTYPSWNDVTKARKSEKATKLQIKRTRELIANLNAQVTETQKDAEVKGAAYQVADQEFQEAALKADELKKQADAARKLADQSVARAGEMAARLYRSGNSDFTLNLLVNASEADDMLYSYGMANKVSAQAEGVYETATQDQNTAQALTDQADVAEALLKDLQEKAEKAFEVAQAAADIAADALEEQQANQNSLTAQLAVLVERRKVTEKDYLKGVRIREKNNNIGLGEVSANGWTRPAGGRITSGFGYRANPFGGGGGSNHQGTDIGAGCGGAIYAAHSGTVVYSGWNGVYGYYIQIDNGDGIQTAYGHIQAGGLLVSIGQDVGVGTQIAKAGATGGATGCHLHYGVLVNGVVTNPVPFMRNQGITLG